MMIATTTQTINVDWRGLAGFTPKQITAAEAAYLFRFILYGGARGGGKSRLLRWLGIELLMYYYTHLGQRGVIGGLFCETYPELRDRQINKIKREFPQWLGELKETKADGLAFHIKEDFGGGVLALRNLDNVDKYQSAEFAFILVDELTKIPFDTFEVLRGSLRWPGIRHTLFMGATNPGGIGHLWVKSLWIDGEFPPEMEKLSTQFKFIQSLPADNPHLEPEYWDDLNSLSPELQRAWVQGEWDIFSGQAFKEWRRDKHVVEPFTIPDYWPRWIGIDWGYAKPFVALWIAKEPDTGRHYVYREVAEVEMLDTVQAKVIKDLSEGELIKWTLADPSIWARKTVGDIVTSTADEYAKEKVYPTKANNDRIDGKRKVHRILGNLPDGEPGLKVFSTCKYLIKTLPALPYDKHVVEDVDTDAEDHAYDALRYGLTYYNVTPKKTANPLQQMQNPLSGLKGI